ncbi:3174_t:CDS:2 [Racocetra fulgida]|uniref:3174_t:CDS:1 n=1 Tax=Racocetra fulgida TaxID=60492 RepID=A0A9N8ZW53_9GLOM|nr:3174_t:CDS:2 [Racocetra fulgida]
MKSCWNADLSQRPDAKGLLSYFDSIIEKLNNKEIVIPEIEFDLSSLNDDYASNSQKSKTIDFEGIPKPKNGINIEQLDSSTCVLNNNVSSHKF